MVDGARPGSGLAARETGNEEAFREIQPFDGGNFLKKLDFSPFPTFPHRERVLFWKRFRFPFGNFRKIRENLDFTVEIRKTVLIFIEILWE
jgi:hypothetical protein